MNCIDIQNKISSYIDGDLNAQEQQEIKEHLLECENCSSEYDILIKNIDALKEVPEVQLPQGFKEDLHSKLIVEQKKRKILNWKSYSVVAASLLILVVSALQNQYFDKNDNLMQESARQENHPTYYYSMPLNDSEENLPEEDGMDDLMENSPKSLTKSIAPLGNAPPSYIEESVLKTTGHIMIKKDTIESAIAYFKKYDNASGYYLDMKTTDNEILLEISPNGFDHLFDYMTEYSNVIDYYVDEINTTEQYDDANESEDTDNNTSNQMTLAEEEIETDSTQPIKNATIIIEVIQLEKN